MPSKPNHGGLWPNKYKTVKAAPDYVGQININGVVHKLVAWKCSSKNPRAPQISIRIDGVDEHGVALTKQEPAKAAAPAQQTPAQQTPATTVPDPFDIDTPPF